MSKLLQHLQQIELWPGVAPGSEGVSLEQTVEERSPDTAAFHDRAVTGIERPTLTAYLPEKPNGTSIVLAPGGGYVRVVLDKEGIEIARWLNGFGITVFLLLYRLPGEGHAQRNFVPLQDAQRALRLVRANAAAWGLAPDRVGAMGCSAGGHVISSLATLFGRQAYAPVDAVDDVSARPDFVSLLYPVITMDARWAHKGSREKLLGCSPDAPPAAALEEAWSTEKQVGRDTPPCFITHAADDESVPVHNALDFHRALVTQGVEGALHIFERGGHGHGIRLAVGKPVEAWTGLFERWLRAHACI
ncbi:MAG: alpha/beta hydrolase [Candidatus Dactylopiibacterium sp.]|nr:alpha/beta hydrolase [Candidatus Dactylopiibacterium sp.]